MSQSGERSIVIIGGGFIGLACADYLRRDGAGLLHKWRERLEPVEQAFIRRETEALAAEFGYGSADWEWVPAA